ncbi:MAG: ABC transporter permease subunit, partial [Planctomycetes bacterium]|nr:ABC transporter permease subunit [Planctomycetota bacterium]
MNWTGLIRRAALGAVIPLLALIVWHAASGFSAIVPTIGQVAAVLADPLSPPPALDSISLFASATVSVLRVVIGFALACLTGIPLGLLVGRSRRANELFSPAISAIMVISPVAWLPITILVFGLSTPATVLYGDEAWRADLLNQLTFAIVAVIWLGASFPVILDTAAGARAVRQAHIERATALGASRPQVLTKVILPAAAPAIVTGVRVGGGIAWRVIVAAEIFPGTRGGLGYMITTAHAQASYEYAFASILVIGLIGLSIDG